MHNNVSKRFDELKATGLLPSPTGVAMEILRLTQSDDSTAKQIAQAIQVDPALTGRTLKIANSSHSGARSPVSSVTDAIVRLGMRTVGTLALGFSVLSSSRSGPCVGFSYDGFWSRSLVLGIATRALCTRTKAAQAEEGFACGLLSHIGRLALASVYPKKYAEALTQANEGNGELKHLEQREFGADSIELTAAMMQDWGLPEAFSDAVMERGDRNTENKLAKVLQTSEFLADLFTAEPQDRVATVKKLLSCYEELGLKADTLEELYEEVNEQWQTLGEMLEIHFHEVPSFEDLLNHAETHHEAAETAHNEEPDMEAEDNSLPVELRILVAEDDPLQQKLIKRLVEGAGHAVITANNGEEALRLALETNPEVVLTDWMMPEMDGFQLCRALRKTHFGRQFYLIVMTSSDEEERLIEAFEAGADDYIVKPLKARPLQARIRAAERLIKLQREVEQERENIREMTAELAVANRKLEQAAFTDALTGLPNRRFLIKSLKQSWENMSRTDGELSCMLLDIDKFKSVNDTYGHDVGDLVLQKVAQILQNVTRGAEFVCRQGGEEFIVVCPGSGLEEAILGAERIRSAIEEQTLGAFEQFDHSVTVSIGVATCQSEMRDEDSMLKKADEALYQAKESGRNRVCAAEQTPEEKVGAIQGTLRSLFK